MSVLIVPGPGASRRVKEDPVEGLSVYVFNSVLACAASAGLATVARHRSPVVADNVSNENDAAFRDGLFLGQLDAEGGRKPHLNERSLECRCRSPFVRLWIS